MTNKALLNVSETAEYVGIKRRTFYKYVQDGTFPVTRVPMMHPPKWAKVELDRWLIDPAAYKSR